MSERKTMARRLWMSLSFLGLLVLPACAQPGGTSPAAERMETCSATYGPGTRGYAICLREKPGSGS